MNNYGGYSSDQINNPMSGPTYYQPNQNWIDWNKQPIQQVYQNFTYVQDPLSELSNATGCYIKQVPDYIECLGKCCEKENQYHVFANTPQGTKYLFKVQERSNCCCRVCCPASNRSFKLEFKHIAAANDFMGGDFSNLFARSEKECRCMVLCCCRPEMKTYKNQTNQELSKVVYPCTCCGLTFDIYEANALKYIADVSCCQCGVCCCSGCVKCYNVEIPIYAANNRSLAVGMILKKKYQNCGECCTAADTFEIVFPSTASAQDKFNIICAGIMIDYTKFE
jgi:hypothetical protein